MEHHCPTCAPYLSVLGPDQILDWHLEVCLPLQSVTFMPQLIESGASE